MTRRRRQHRTPPSLGAAAAALALLALTSCGLDEGDLPSTGGGCKLYLEASTSQQKAVVDELATSLGEPDATDPAVLDRIAELCRDNPDRMLTEIVDDAIRSAKDSAKDRARDAARDAAGG